MEHTDGAPPFRSPSIYLDEFEALSMMDKQDIDQIALRLVSLVPPGLAQVQQDLRTNFRDVLAQGLRRLDLVTREEFDVQTQVLPGGIVAEIRGHPMPGGGFVATFTDVTQFRQAEAGLKRIAETLEQRVAELEAVVAARGGQH